MASRNVFAPLGQSVANAGQGLSQGFIADRQARRQAIIDEEQRKQRLQQTQLTGLQLQSAEGTLAEQKRKQTLETGARGARAEFGKRETAAQPGPSSGGTLGITNKLGVTGIQSTAQDATGLGARRSRAGGLGLDAFGEFAGTDVEKQITGAIAEQGKSGLQDREFGLASRKLDIAEFEAATKLAKLKQEQKAGLSSDLIPVANKKSDQFVNLSKDFIKVRDSFGRILASAEEPSAAGDLAMIFNYMKVLDPGSVVRESEFATAQNAGGVDDKTRGLYNQIVNGKRLSPNQRNDFSNRARKLFEAQEKQQVALENQFSILSQNLGIAPKFVVLDFRTIPKENKPVAKKRKSTRIN